MNSFQTLIESSINPVGKSGKDIIYICPKCDDKSGHLYVNYEINKFNCFKCGFGGKNILYLVKALNIPTDFDYEDLGQTVSNRSELLDSIIEGKEEEIKEVDYSINVRVLTEFYYLNTKEVSDEARNYLYSRGITDSMIEFYKIREGINRYKDVILINDKPYQGLDYSGRVLVPSLTKDDLISYYVARDYLGFTKMRYMNPPKELSFASEDVWCLDKVTLPYVIICEGVFTALSVNSRLNKHVAVSTYGKGIAVKTNSEYRIRGTSQLKKLIDKKFDKYFLFYDRDAIEESYRYAKLLMDYGCDTKLILIPTDDYGKKADAADLPDEVLLDCISNAKNYSSLDNAFIGLTI